MHWQTRLYVCVGVWVCWVACGAQRRATDTANVQRWSDRQRWHRNTIEYVKLQRHEYLNFKSSLKCVIGSECSCWKGLIPFELFFYCDSSSNITCRNFFSSPLIQLFCLTSAPELCRTIITQSYIVLDNIQRIADHCHLACVHRETRLF